MEIIIDHEEPKLYHINRDHLLVLWASAVDSETVSLTALTETPRATYD